MSRQFGSASTRPNPTKAESAGIWQPPTGWIAHAPGVWLPSDYRPTRWELPTPVVYTGDQAKEEYAKCAKSLPYFAFRYVWTLDTDDPNGISVRKFPTYPYLRRFFQEVQKPENTHTEKSRQMLLTWAWMITFAWDALFTPNYAGLVLSKRSADVDDGGNESTPNSNLGKIRFVIEHLPEHLWKPTTYKKFMIRVGSMHSHIKGETGKGGMAARGPTYKRAIMDEAAYVERSETVFSGLRQAAKTGTVLNSTPQGMGNTFARIRFSATTTFKKLSFHWSEHPRKSIGLYCICGWKAAQGAGKSPREQYEDHARASCPRVLANPPLSPEMRSPWYDRESSDMTPDKVASDLDISYKGSRRGIVYRTFDQIRNVKLIYHLIGPRRLEETIEDYRARYLRRVIRPNAVPFTSWDIGIGDPTALLFGQIVNDTEPRIEILDEFQTNGESYDFYARIVNNVWRPACVSSGNMLAMRHYGGQDVKNRDSKLESWWSNLKLEGIQVETEYTGDLLDWVDFISVVGFRSGALVISEWCKELLDAISNYHYPTDETGEPIPGKQLPVHDEWSHYADSLRHLYRVRYRDRLHDRTAQAVPLKKILRRGSGYDPNTETRKF